MPLACICRICSDVNEIFRAWADAQSTMLYLPTSWLLLLLKRVHVEQ